MEQIEFEQDGQQEAVTLEGELQSLQFQTKYFKTLSALCDYVKTFNIQNGSFKYGLLDNQYVFQLEYAKVNH